MHLFNTRRRKVLATFATCLVAGLGAVALAAWLTDGTGEGTTKVGNLTQPTVTPGGISGLNGCLPGGNCDAKFSVQNPNNVDMVVTGIDPAVGSADTGTSNQPTLCPYTEITANSKSGLAGQSITIPQGSTAEITVPGAYKLAADAPTECQGVQLTRGATLHFTTP